MQQHMAHRKQNVVPATYEAYRVKKLLNGLVLGGLDKNQGETWAMCPSLYAKAHDKAFQEKTGYTPVYAWKCSQYQRKKHNTKSLLEHVSNCKPAPKQSQGNEFDIKMAWKLRYKEAKWNQYGTFDTKGGFNVPYILPKAKNVTDTSTRREKWMKARPIAPSTKHPMRQVLHRAGRAWYFISRNIPGDHFVLDKCEDVPAKMQKALQQLEHVKGQLKIANHDIEGCYPNMPKDIMKQAARWVCGKLEQSNRVAVWVPRRGRKPCQFSIRQTVTWKYTKIPFAALQELMDFSLDNALIRMPDGTLKRQSQGVPMGDAISPGATVIALAYMEHMFLTRLPPTVRSNFVGIRYMDDLLTIYKDNSTMRGTLKHMQQSMYKGELRLEAANESLFLETRFEITQDGVLALRLKNSNEDKRIAQVWRYQHWYSATSYTLKRSILLAALKKVHKMANNEEQLRISAQAKIREFDRAGYPFGVIKYMCNIMTTTTGSHVWKNIKTSNFTPTCTTIDPKCGTVTRPVGYPLGISYES